MQPLGVVETDIPLDVLPSFVIPGRLDPHQPLALGALNLDHIPCHDADKAVADASQLSLGPLAPFWGAGKARFQAPKSLSRIPETSFRQQNPPAQQNSTSDDKGR